MSLRKISTMILVVGLLLAVAGVSMVVAKPKSDGTGPFGLLPREEAQISHLESVLDSSQLTAETRQNMEEKLVLVQRAADERLQGLANPAPKNPNRVKNLVSASDEEINPPFPTGIFDGSEGNFKPDQAVITNRWQGIIGQELVQAFAGSQGVDPQQGIIIVIRMDDNRQGTGFQIYSTPAKAGTLRIVNAEGSKLTVSAENGTQWVFDVATGEYQ